MKVSLTELYLAVFCTQMSERYVSFVIGEDWWFDACREHLLSCIVMLLSSPSWNSILPGGYCSFCHSHPTSMALGNSGVVSNNPISTVSEDVLLDRPLSRADRSKPFPRKYAFDFIDFIAFFVFVQRHCLNSELLLTSNKTSEMGQL